MQYRIGWLLSAAALCVAGCTASDRTCDRNTDCPRDQICRYGQCLDRKSDFGPASTPADTGQTEANVDGTAADSEPISADSDTDSADDGETTADSQPTVRQLDAPAELQFDSPGTERTAELTNVGNTAVTVTERTVTGNVFSLTSVRYRSEDGERLAELPVRLAPGDTLAARVRYDSSEAGNDRGTLVFTSNAAEGPTEIALTGQTGGCLDVPEKLEFPVVPVDSTESGVLSVRNCSERTAFEFEASLVDDDDGFSIRVPDRVTVPPGESYAIAISIDPDGEFRRFEGRVLIETTIPDRPRVTVEVGADTISD